MGGWERMQKATVELQEVSDRATESEPALDTYADAAAVHCVVKRRAATLVGGTCHAFGSGN